MSESSDPATFVVNADDLGLSVSANEGIFLAHERGIVSSASLALTTRAAEAAVGELSRHPRLAIGLHFCLTAGRPVADRSDVPDLVDGSGFFRWRFAPLLFALRGPRRAALLSQISIELDAQLGLARSHDLALDHIDGERHIHLLPGIFELVVAAAPRHRIPHIRLIDDVGARYLSLARKLAASLDGGWLKLSLLSALSRRARRVMRSESPVRVRYATLLRTGRMHEVMPQLWAQPPRGVTELAVHPGLPDRMGSGDELGNAALSRYLASADRRRELDACLGLGPAGTPARLATFAEVYSAPGAVRGRG